MSEGPVRSSPSFALLFPVYLGGMGMGGTVWVGWQTVPLHSDAVLSSMKTVWREEVELVGHDSIMAGDQSFV